MMQCRVCQKGEVKDYADGTCHCNNKNCLMDYTPPVYGRGDLRKQVAKPLWQIIIMDIFSFLVSPEGIKFMFYICMGVVIGVLFGFTFIEARLEGF